MRWPGLGVQRRTPRPAAEAARSRRASRASPGALGGMSYRRCQPPRHVEAPEAVERLPRRRGRRPETVSPPGVAQSRLQTSRAGRRRMGGLAALRSDGAFRKASSCLTAARRSGPRVRSGPGVPRALLSFGRGASQTSGAKARRENDGGWLKSNFASGESRNAPVTTVRSRPCRSSACRTPDRPPQPGRAASGE